jgi:hypothetical protein
MNKYSLSQIGNSDETAVFVDMPRNYTVHFEADKQTAMKTTRYEKFRAAVMLCIAANGNKLPQYDERNMKQKDGAESTFLGKYNSSGPKN